ncbi:unnamed protein product [Prunus armeniaca]
MDVYFIAQSVQNKTCTTKVLLFVAQSQSDISLSPSPPPQPFVKSFGKSQACATNDVSFVAQSVQNKGLCDEGTPVRRAISVITFSLFPPSRPTLRKIF